LLCAALIGTTLACGPRAARAPASAPPTAPAVAVAADPERAGIDKAALTEKLDAYVASFGAQWGEAYGFTGFIFVAQGGEPVYAKGFGMADRDAKSVPTANTTFRIGSVTKQFTAAAILELQEQGKLSVHDTVRQHLPNYPEGDRITVHQLLTHTSGVWSYTSDIEWMKTDAATPHTTEQMVATFKDKPLDFEPGEKFSYSNSGYVLLGAIVEAASGQSYADFVEKEIFAAAGLTRTTYGDDPALGDVAKGYVIGRDERIEPASKIDMSVPHGAGAIRSTANDLVKWHAALTGDEILSAESKGQLYRPEQANYAYGWVVTKVGEHTRIGHNGGINGFSSFYARLPDEDIVVVAWTNHEGFALDPLGEAVVRFAVGEPVPPHEETPVVEMDRAVAKRSTGGYVMTDEARQRAAEVGLPPEVVDSLEAFELRFEGEALMLEPIGQPSFRVFASGPASFFIKSPPVEIAVDLPEAGGPATKITLRQGPLVLAYARDDRGAKEARKAFKKRNGKATKKKAK
jgi:CubicO group peptidase (beta-lactamase class C family)